MSGGRIILDRRVHQRLTRLEATALVDTARSYGHAAMP
jgi:hypothetical protein